MDPINSGEEETESHDEEEGDVSSGNKSLSKRLIQGINLKDLYEGKDIMFELSDDYNEDYFIPKDSPNLNEVVHWDPEKLRETRGAPPNGSFDLIAENMVNVTEDGLVKKQLIIAGTGKVVPDYAYVTVHYNLYKENCETPFDSTYMRNYPEKIKLDQGQTIQGLEYAIKSMKKGENSRFFIKWEVAFGALGCPDRIGEKCDIIADITLLNFVEIIAKEEADAVTDEKLNRVDFATSMGQAKVRHCNGSDSFKKGDIKSAIFKKAVRILDGLTLANEEEETQMLRLKVKCLVNLAICFNKLGKYEEACVVCQDALSIEPNNAKGYFHYGRANLALSNFKQAQRLLLKAIKLKPDDTEISKELKKLNDKKALYEMKNQMFWKKAFKQDEKGEEEEKVPEKEPPSSLETFEEDLKSSLKHCMKEKKPYVLSGALLEDEKKICKRIADSMNLNFEKKEDFFVFRTKPNTS